MIKKIILPILIICFLFLPLITIASGGGGGGPVELNNPLTGSPGEITGGVPALIGRVINAVLGIVGSLALLMFVYGGLLWMTAGGKEDKITQGKNVLIWATLGLVVIFSSYAIVKLLLTSLAG